MFVMLVFPCLFVFLLLAMSYVMDAAQWIARGASRAFWPRRRRRAIRRVRV